MVLAGERDIVVLGDSISAGYGLQSTDSGWVALLQAKLTEKGIDYKLNNESVSGDTTDGGLARIDSVLKRHQPSWVLIELGGNDALQGKDIAHINNNLRQLCSKVQSSGAQCALLTMQIPPNFGPRYAKAFSDTYGDVAAELNATLVPFILEGVGGHREYMQQDGIHPNEEGQPIIADIVFKALVPNLTAD